LQLWQIYGRGSLRLGVPNEVTPAFTAELRLWFVEAFARHGVATESKQRAGIDPRRTAAERRDQGVRVERVDEWAARDWEATTGERAATYRQLMRERIDRALAPPWPTTKHRTGTLSDAQAAAR